jgi:transcriptional regulator with XRE-family HTH domain
MNQEKIGKLIKDLRIKNNLTQKDLATKLNVTYQAVSKWENGLNIPDIAILKELSNLFHVDLNDLLNGEVVTKKNKNHKHIIIIAILATILVILSIFIIIHIHNSNFEFKTITTTCNNFKITGSAAYNKDKTSIYISNINYCGGNDNTKYLKINCNLYNEKGLKISSCSQNNNTNITLEDYLKNASIKIDNSSNFCNLNKTTLYLKIEAIESTDKTTTYKIPLTLTSC